MVRLLHTDRYIYINIHTYIYICIHTYVYTYVSYRYRYIHVYLYIYMCRDNTSIFICEEIYQSLYRLCYTHLCIHTYMHTEPCMRSEGHVATLCGYPAPCTNLMARGEPESLGVPDHLEKERPQFETSLRAGVFLPVSTLPVGSYHTPVLGYPTLWLWDPNSKTRYPQKGVWYKPTGMIYVILTTLDSWSSATGSPTVCKCLAFWALVEPAPIGFNEPQYVTPQVGPNGTLTRILDQPKAQYRGLSKTPISD